MDKVKRICATALSVAQISSLGLASATNLDRVFNKYYFFDHSVVDEAKDAELEIEQVTKTTSNTSWIDQYGWTTDSDVPDWEHRVTIMYPYVLYDENGISVDGVSAAKYKIWYHTWNTKSRTEDFDWRKGIIEKEGKAHQGGHVLCYMESNDGINWTRPDCGQFDYMDQNGNVTGTNIVHIGNHGIGVTKNTHPQAGITEPKFLFAAQSAEAGNLGVAVSWSDDGIHWEEPITVMPDDASEYTLHADTQNYIFWSPEQNCYLAVTRSTISGVRTVLQIKSKSDLTSLSDLKTIKEQSTAENYWSDTQKYWTTPEIILPSYSEAYPKSSQPYCMPSSKVSDRYYIGHVSIYNREPSVTDPEFMSVHGELIWSTDGTNWNYMKAGTPFIPNADNFELKKGNDYGLIYSAPPVVTSEGTKFFYAAAPELHYTQYGEIPEDIKQIVDEAYPAAKEAEDVTRTTALNVATVKNDHFASYSAVNGTVTTCNFDVSGGEIRITADINNGGSVTAAVLNEYDQVIEGFSHADFTSITENAVDSKLAWTGNEQDLIGKKIKIEFKLNNAKLYTISGNITQSAVEEIDTNLFWKTNFENGFTDALPWDTGAELVSQVVYYNTFLAQDLEIPVTWNDDFKAKDVLIDGVSVGADNISVDGDKVIISKDYAKLLTKGEKKLDIVFPVGGLKTTKLIVTDAMLEDDFETTLDNGNWTRIKDGNNWVTDFTSLNNPAIITHADAYSGDKVFALKNNGIALLEKDYGKNALYNKVIDVWFYDDGANAEVETMLKVVKNTKPLIGLGIKTGISADEYVYLYYPNIDFATIQMTGLWILPL